MINSPDPNTSYRPRSLLDIQSLSDSILCDILVPPVDIVYNHPIKTFDSELLARHSTGYSFVSVTMAADESTSPAQVYDSLRATRATIEGHRETMILVDSVEDIRAAKQAGKLGVNFHFQGTEPIGRNLANVKGYYDLGIRWMLMAYNFQNNVGTGCIEAETNDIGLSAFGRDLIAEMNRIGMIVDCSHSGYRTTMEAMEASSQPCIFSHSNPRALFDHPRNIRDDQIRACAASGGVIGINGVGEFIGEPKAVSIETVIRNIDYIVDLVGPEHVAFGLDYVTPGDVQLLYDHYNGDVQEKIGLGELPWSFLHPAAIPQLLTELLSRGYPLESVKGIMGENFLRVANAVWR